MIRRPPRSTLFPYTTALPPASRSSNRRVRGPRAGPGCQSRSHPGVGESPKANATHAYNEQGTLPIVSSGQQLIFALMQRLNKYDSVTPRLAMANTPAFNIVIVYETLAAAIRVKEMSDRLATDLRPACKLNCEFWRFDLLTHPSFRAKAATEASQADMIIVAARGASELMAD